MRVTVDEVKEIFDTAMTNGQITAFITVANLLVTNVVEIVGLLAADELKEVERWLAAHFACIRDPVSLRSKIGDAESWNFPAAVTTAWGRSLNLTVYGQQAVAMDRTGSLAKLGLIKASFRAAPRENSDHFTDGLTRT